MAITATSVRNHLNTTDRSIRVFGTLTLSGTYATGGFTANLNPVAGPGTSQAPSRAFTAPMAQDFYSPNGYTYRVVSGTPNAAVVKILNGTAELANGTAVPDTTLPFRAELLKYFY